MRASGRGREILKFWRIWLARLFCRQKFWHNLNKTDARECGGRMQQHRIDAGPDTVHWGFFDAGLKPIITVDSGDQVTISTVSGAPEAMPKTQSGLTVPPTLAAIHASVPQRLGPHIMTGPVAVRGAKAGQVLEVRIKSIELHYDWGYNAIRPLAGALPDAFASMRLIHIPLDRTRMIGRLPWG